MTLHAILNKSQNYDPVRYKWTHSEKNSITSKNGSIKACDMRSSLVQTHISSIVNS